MKSNDGISELAKMLKDRENKEYTGPVVGIVLSPLPDIKIQAGRIMLDKDSLVIAGNILEGYEREFEAKNVVVEGSTENAVVSGSEHKHEIKALNINGKLILKDALKAGDAVILIPSADEQTYFLLDKAVRL